MIDERWMDAWSKILDTLKLDIASRCGAEDEWKEPL